MEKGIFYKGIKEIMTDISDMRLINAVYLLGRYVF